eukprot:CAMPEP_0174754058 /NCGR_PEP_ID=MMETSP1094-20130205/105299_1 /TAXON_ID=156173 /ORGANISM="Chrysochromulina brevifilum, Strain UTEX LB 985" /LENGTH=153 /DNA_ID=CAMNT_0015959895 /DNA_START=207 /DNA_END=670 /DNA_ORIENTATION=+
MNSLASMDPEESASACLKAARMLLNFSSSLLRMKPSTSLTLVTVAASSRFRLGSSVGRLVGTSVAKGAWKKVKTMSLIGAALSRKLVLGTVSSRIGGGLGMAAALGHDDLALFELVVLDVAIAVAVVHRNQGAELFLRELQALMLQRQGELFG